MREERRLCQRVLTVDVKRRRREHPKLAQRRILMTNRMMLVACPKGPHRPGPMATSSGSTRLPNRALPHLSRRDASPLEGEFR